MAPAGDSSHKRKKRKGERNPASSTKKQKRDDEEEDEGEEEEAHLENDEEEDQATNLNTEVMVDHREREVIPGRGRRVSDFPSVVRHSINRPHPMILAIVAVERTAASGLPIQIENISHGQLQVLSSVLPEHSYLVPPDPDKPPAYVCTPPALMEGKGIAKQFGSGVLVLPAHSDWFNPMAVHRIERQAVPHFFTGKSNDHTPEKYTILRNKIVAKYLETPSRNLSAPDCQALIHGSGMDATDLSRVVRFLDNWGIINYLAVADRPELKSGDFDFVLREESDWELNLNTAALKSVDGLVQFDRPRSSCRAEDLDSVSSSSDLDRLIRERLSEHLCAHCSRPLTEIHYQSPKEVEVSLCSDCYHDGRFVVGHSSLSFVRAESLMDACEVSGDHWSDQETLLLLEALEVFNDNWNEIADHVGTKSKAQCMLHFLRLPVEEDLLENIPVPGANSDGREKETSNLNVNGFSLGDENAESRLPFANSGNPLMSLVAFLAAALGPRVSAACASAALSVLSKEDAEADRHPTDRDEAADGMGNAPSSALSPDKVKAAAASGLSAAATKAKLFADQEEREIQRLVAGIVHHQLKRLELKLKQFAEVEAFLMKECDQAERARQRLAAERSRLSSSRFAPDLAGEQSNRPAAMAVPAIGQSGGAAAFYGGTPANLPQISSFLVRQPQAFPLGPRLPLSAIHSSPSSSSPAGNAPSNHFPLLRPPNIG